MSKKSMPGDVTWGPLFPLLLIVIALFIGTSIILDGCSRRRMERFEKEIVEKKLEESAKSAKDAASDT